MDRRQHRLQGHHEVPGRLPDGRARQGRDAVDRLRRRGPAPGRRRQDGPHGAEHLVERSSPSRWRAAAAAPPTAVWSQVARGRATARKSTVQCDALLVDTITRSDTYPYVDVREDDVSMGHEATVSKVSEDQLFYLMSRGMTEDEAMAMIVRGFVEPIARELPDGVRPRAQPADRAADGRSGRLSDRPPTRALPQAPSRPAATARLAHPHSAGVAVPPSQSPRASAPRRSTSPTSRSRTAARRSGGSPRSTGCAACTTAPPSRPAAAVEVDVDAPEGVTVETVGRDDARARQGRHPGRPGRRPGVRRRSRRPRSSPCPRRPCSTEPVRDRRARRGRHRLRPPGRRASAPFAEAVVVLDHTGDARARRQRRDRRRRRRQADRRHRAGLGRRRRARRPARRAASAATPASSTSSVTLGGDLVRLNPTRRLRRPRRRRRAARPLLRRRRPAPRAPALRRPRGAALQVATSPTRARCRARARTPSGSATC